MYSKVFNMWHRNMHKDDITTGNTLLHVMSRKLYIYWLACKLVTFQSWEKAKCSNYNVTLIQNI